MTPTKRGGSAQQLLLISSVAEENLRVVEGILSRFLDWHGSACVLVGDRAPVKWLALEVREYFAAGTDWEASV